MASETTFDHWKVVFLMRKSEKKALTFEALCSRFEDLHFWNPLAICENLASTKKMGVFFDYGPLQDPCVSQNMPFSSSFWAFLKIGKPD